MERREGNGKTVGNESEREKGRGSEKQLEGSVASVPSNVYWLRK